MCITTPTPASPSSAPSPRTPDAEGLLPPTSPIDDFNAQLALAKIEALNCLLKLCRNEDCSASPEEIRRAASAILRCPPLRPPDPTGSTGVPSAHPQRRHTSAAAVSPAETPAFTPADTSQPAAPSNTLTHAPFDPAPPVSPIAPTPPSPHPRMPDAECRMPSSPPDAECRVPLAPVAQSAAPPPPAPTIAHHLGNPSPQPLTPSTDEIFHALAALEALRKSDPQRHQNLDPGNTLQPLIDFIRSVYPAAGLPPDHPLSIAIRDIESAYSAAERQTAALDEALADLRATAPSASTPIHDPPDRNSPSNQHDLDPPPGPCAFDVAPNAYTFASSPDARGPPEPTAA
jgi:hypothetical protein